MKTRRSLRRLGATLALLLLFVAVVPAVSPVYLPALPDGAPPPPEEETLVFGYATLANPLVRSWVLGRPSRSEPGTLEGWTRVGRDLLPYPDGAVQGRVFSVPPEGMTRLDRFEQTGLRYMRRREVLTDGREVWVYGLLPPLPAR